MQCNNRMVLLSVPCSGGHSFRITTICFPFSLQQFHLFIYLGGLFWARKVVISQVTRKSWLSWPQKATPLDIYINEIAANYFKNRYVLPVEFNCILETMERSYFSQSCFRYQARAGKFSPALTLQDIFGDFSIINLPSIIYQ